MSIDTSPVESSTTTPYTLASEEEIAAVTDTLREAGYFPDTDRMTYVRLLDPVRGTERSTTDVDR